ncbi:unnamed protein product [Parascedosporium putredinis]|uniref:Uncharacterized protein n=1 Tax=Parascedosporium putredinis TaxID=1442378 RepID=A0A9P1H091_9PEZI|nr:unnamed protein product [Parascedosporium putredinis]CAI7993656.1 unnamed protein product [Parascedosporium putredinis]
MKFFSPLLISLGWLQVVAAGRFPVSPPMTCCALVSCQIAPSSAGFDDCRNNLVKTKVETAKVTSTVEVASVVDWTTTSVATVAVPIAVDLPADTITVLSTVYRTLTRGNPVYVTKTVTAVRGRSPRDEPPPTPLPALVQARGVNPSAVPAYAEPSCNSWEKYTAACKCLGIQPGLFTSTQAETEFEYVNVPSTNTVVEHSTVTMEVQVFASVAPVTTTMTTYVQVTVRPTITRTHTVQSNPGKAIIGAAKYKCLKSRQGVEMLLCLSRTV